MKINLNNNKLKSLILLSLVSSASTNEGNPNNQTGIDLNNNQLPEVAANFTKRQAIAGDPNKTLVFAGYPVALSDNVNINGVSKRFIKYCTAGFMIVNNNSSNCVKDIHFESGNDYGGFLTSTFCWPTTPGIYSSDVYGWDGSLLLGRLHYGSLGTDIVDYGYISNNGTWNNLKLIPYVRGNKELYPVTGLGSVILGSKVCAYGTVSGHLCGNITEINAKLTVPYPYFPVDPKGNLALITLGGLSKVDLGVNGFYGEENLGGPVYVESNIGGQTTAQALGYITNFDNSDPNHKSFYYTQLDTVLKKLLADHNCTYTLMTYNEQQSTNKDFQAQVEIPPKK